MVLQMVLICTFRTGLFMITVHGRYMFKSRYSARLKRLLFTVLLCFLRGLYTLDKKKLKLFYDHFPVSSFFILIWFDNLINYS